MIIIENGKPSLYLYIDKGKPIEETLLRIERAYKRHSSYKAIEIAYEDKVYEIDLEPKKEKFIEGCIKVSLFNNNYISCHFYRNNTSNIGKISFTTDWIAKHITYYLLSITKIVFEYPDNTEIVINFPEE